MEVADRTLPHNLDAERAVLGAVLLHGDLWHEVATAINEGEFFRQAHRRVFSAMAKLVASGAMVDVVTLMDELRTSGELDECGGPAYVSALMDGVPRSINVAHYAAIVREKAQLRETIFAASNLLSAAYDEQPSQEVVEDGVRMLLSLGSAHADGQPVNVGKAAMDYVVALDTPLSDAVMPTGFTDIDEMLSGGLRAGELAIVAARPSVGKSSFGLQVALHMARQQMPTVDFSLEMDTSALAARLVSWGANIDGHRLRMRALGEHDYPRLSQAVADLQDVPLELQDAAPSLTAIAAWCHRLKQRDIGLRCVVVDYMQLMTRKSGRSLTEEVAALSAGLKRLAKEEQIAVVGLSQLSRAPEARSDKRPHLSDLRDSGALEQDADIAILLFREEMHRPTEENAGIAEAIIAKQRNGPTGVVKLVFLKERARFENLAMEAV